MSNTTTPTTVGQAKESGADSNNGGRIFQEVVPNEEKRLDLNAAKAKTGGMGKPLRMKQVQALIGVLARVRVD